MECNKATSKLNVFVFNNVYFFEDTEEAREVFQNVIGREKLRSDEIYMFNENMIKTEIECRFRRTSKKHVKTEEMTNYLWSLACSRFFEGSFSTTETSKHKLSLVDSFEKILGDSLNNEKRIAATIESISTCSRRNRWPFFFFFKDQRVAEALAQCLNKKDN